MSEIVTFTDDFGQVVQMPREEYQKKVIPQNLDKYWDDKEKLREYALHLAAEQFTEQAAAAADRLLELCGPVESVLNFRAVVHMQAREYERAKAILVNCLDRFPSSGISCINLAKVYAAEENRTKALELLEVGLFKDPNQEDGLNMYVEAFLAEGKRDEAKKRLEMLAKREGAWRPQLYLARLALAEQNVQKAMDGYTQAIEKAKERFEAVMAVTADLDQAGFADQVIQVCEAYWKPDFPHPCAGLNYAKALIATGQKEKAIAILHEMHEYLPEKHRPAVERFLARISGADGAKAALQSSRSEESGRGSEKKSWWKFWK